MTFGAVPVSATSAQHDDVDDDAGVVSGLLLADNNDTSKACLNYIMH
jgi:hypothetical protein